MDAEPQKTFPRPPPFYQQFSEDNLKQLEQIRKERLPQNGKPVELQLDDVPPHLQYLLPPSPPTGTYTAFGEQYGVGIFEKLHSRRRLIRRRESP